MYAPEHQRGIVGTYDPSADEAGKDKRFVFDLMPKQFGKYLESHRKRNTFDTTQARRQEASQQLTPLEVDRLFGIISNTPYMMDEALDSGLLVANRGHYHRKSVITRDDVNRFAGRVGRTFTYGAAGMPAYGIDDILSLDEQTRKKIVRKENQAVTSSTRVAFDLAEQFGDWLDPYLAES